MMGASVSVKMPNEGQEAVKRHLIYTAQPVVMIL